MEQYLVTRLTRLTRSGDRVTVVVQCGRYDTVRDSTVQYTTVQHPTLFPLHCTFEVGVRNTLPQKQRPQTALLEPPIDFVSCPILDQVFPIFLPSLCGLVRRIYIYEYIYRTIGHHDPRQHPPL